MPNTGPWMFDAFGIGVRECHPSVALHRLDDRLGRHLVPERHGVARIERVHLDRLLIGRVLEARRVPHERLRGGPGKVADVLRLEVPGERRRARRARARRHHLVRLDDELRRFRGECLGQARALRRREHLRLVQDDAGALHDVVVRHREAHVVVAEVEVELALPQELVGLPAVHVIVDGGAGVPLRHLVEPSVLHLLAHPPAIAAVLGHVRRTSRSRAPPTHPRRAASAAGS